MSGSRPAALVFDLDGTLLDTAPVLTAAVNAARALGAHPPLAVATVAPHIGGGLGALLAATLPPGYDEAAARAAFHATCRARLLESRPYPDADAVVAALGSRAALVTNKPRTYLDALLAHLGWRFAAVVDGDDPAGRKPDPGPLLHAAARLGVAPAAALAIGDSPLDRAAARAAGMPYRPVAWGHVAPGERPLTALAELLAWG